MTENKPTTTATTAATVFGKRTAYIVTSFIHKEKEVLSNDHIRSESFSSKLKARNYMKEHARKLYDEYVTDYEDGHTYFRELDNYIDFGNNGDDYRSSLEDWGFVKMDKVYVDAAIVPIKE